MKNAFEYEAELAALREELAEVSGTLEFNTNCFGRERAVMLDKQQTLAADLIACGRHRKAAEQRNAELVELTKDALKAFNYHPEGSCYNPGIAFVKPWSIRAAELIKPTEAGASE